MPAEPLQRARVILLGKEQLWEAKLPPSPKPHLGQDGELEPPLSSQSQQGRNAAGRCELHVMASAAFILLEIALLFADQLFGNHN